MSRSYGQVVEVSRGGWAAGGPGCGAVEGAPSEFRWRGRRYSVRGVLAHWREAACWWRPGPARAYPADPEVWRVEAATPAGAAGVYDLSFEPGEGRWRVARMHD